MIICKSLKELRFGAILEVLMEMLRKLVLQKKKYLRTNYSKFVQFLNFIIIVIRE